MSARWLILGVASVGLLTFPFTTQAAVDPDLRLVEASKKGDSEALSSLLEQGLDVNAAQPDGSTALAWAVYRDDEETTQLLILAGANPNTANDYGVTPLSLACSNRNPTLVANLLDAGANPNSAIWSGETVLMTCARVGNLESVIALLAKGADVNAREPRRGQSALMWAIAEGHPEVARVLIESGADVHAQSHQLRDLEPKVYLTHDGQVQVSSQGGFTPLLFAAQQGDLETARRLVKAGADVNGATQEDGNSLLLATANGHEELALFLLEEGADPNVAAGDGSGVTALHYALRDGLRALLEGKDAGLFSQIVQEEQRSTTQKKRYSKPNPLPGSSMPRLLKALLERGADPNAQLTRLPARFRKGGNAYISIRGVTPFLLAAAASDVFSIRLLVEKGAESNVTTIVDEPANPTGVYNDQAQFQGSVTPLLAAAGLGRSRVRRAQEAERALETVQLLVQMGADVNKANETGWTPLHAAVYVGADPIIQFLAENGAQLDVKNGCGQTPLTLADATLGRGLVQIPRVRQSTVSLLKALGASASPAVDPVGRCVEGRYGIDYFVARDNLEDAP